MPRRAFLLTVCVAAAAAQSSQTGSLRGVAEPQRRTRRLPANEAMRNNQNARKKQNKSILDRQDEEWKSLSKDEKKKLLLELREEEAAIPQAMDSPVDALQISSDESDSSDATAGKGQGSSADRVSGSQLAYLQQYFNTLDGIELQSASLEEDMEWEDLTKPEKKRVIEMMNSDLKLGEKDKLSKQEKKDKDKNDMEQSSEVAEGGIDNAEDFDEEGGMVQTSGNGGGSGIDNAQDFEESDGTQTVQDDMTQTTEAGGFVLPMPQLTFGGEAETASDFASGEMSLNSDSGANEPACQGCYAFASSLPDNSVQLDSFDPASTLKWTMSGLAWKTVSSSSVDDGCYEGDSCIQSGIVGDLKLDGEEAIYSNLTLTTDDEFEGGVLHFVLAGEGFAMPREVFVVAVDADVALSTTEIDGSWGEYSVSVGQGKHTVTWSHVYNPLGLEALPEKKDGEMGLRMDDLRFSPFDKMNDQGFEDNKGKGLVMTSDGDAVWQVNDEDSNSGKYSIMAKSSSITKTSGSSNVNFVLHSEYGGTLKYKISTSTTAPHDDFAILLNDKPAEAVFGLTPNFDYRSIDVPMGKVVVTLQHRKNPGNLNSEVLDALGKVSTEGFTRLDDVRFEPADNRLN